MILVNEADRQAGALTEAGGLISWIKRAFSNVDNGVVEELRWSLKDIQTEYDRQRVLRELDSFLSEARAALADGTLGDLLRSVGLGGLGAAGGAVAGWAYGTKTAPQLTGMWGRLKAAFGVGRAVHAADRAAYIAGKANTFAAAGFAGMSAIAFVFKTVNRYNGSLEDYVAALELLRREAAALKLPAQGRVHHEQALHEGIGTVLRNLATGDVEEEIDDLRKEARDIHTPEQQRFVITKIVRLLERLIILRHNPGYVQHKFHDSVSWFTRVIGRDDGAKELQTRIGEAIRDLAKLRDEVLAKKWNDEKYNEEVDNLKKKVADLLDAAASRKAEDLE